jgi:hypothetical protein
MIQMSDHEEERRRGYTNGLVTLGKSINALREHIDVVKKEPNKVDINEIETVFNHIEINEEACRVNCNAYVKYLGDNKRRYGKKVHGIIHLFYVTSKYNNLSLVISPAIYYIRHDGKCFR